MKVLAKFQSKTNPGKFYEVRCGDDGVTYCTCPAWRFNKKRTCWHLDLYLSRNKIKHTRKEDGTIVVDLQAIIDQEVEKITGGR